MTWTSNFFEEKMNRHIFRQVVEDMVDLQGWDSEIANEMFSLRNKIRKRAIDYREHQNGLERAWRSQAFFDRLFSKNPARRFDTP